MNSYDVFFLNVLETASCLSFCAQSTAAAAAAANDVVLTPLTLSPGINYCLSKIHLPPDSCCDVIALLSITERFLGGSHLLSLDFH